VNNVIPTDICWHLYMYKYTYGMVLSVCLSVCMHAACCECSDHGLLCRSYLQVTLWGYHICFLLCGATATSSVSCSFSCCCCCSHASKELVQLSLVSLCLISAWLCGQLGLSEELGAFIAGERLINEGLDTVTTLFRDSTPRVFVCLAVWAAGAQ
jgi:hypothetical protein